MFDKSRVPVPNPLHKQHLQNLYNQISTNGEIKALIEKKIDHVYQHNKDQIVHAVTVSQYFDQIWKNPELKEKHKDLAIKKLGAIHVIKKKQILNGEQIVAKTPANLEVVNGIFQMTPFEQFNFHEKLKNIKKNQQLDIENELFSKHSADINVVYALNKGPRAFKSANRAEFLHYTSGLCELDETERTKILKAEEFVKKIKDDKKAFSKKIKQMEKALGDREHDELELYKQKEQKEEEMKLKEKKQRLEAHIKELKARSEVRLKESTKFEEQYKSHLHLDKRPMFKEIERNFKKGYAIPELEERKKKLQEIRNFHKPITKEDIETHEQKVVKMVEERSLQRKVLAQTSKWTYEKPTFESKHHKTFAEELTRLRHQKENGLEDHKKKQEKVMELLQDVKDRHFPKADPQKELELANLVEQLKKRKDRRDWLPEIDQSPDQQIDGRKLGGEYLKGVKDMIQKYQKEHPKKPEAGSPTKGGETPRKVVNNRSLIVSPKGDGSPVMKDYLLELRKENKIQSSSKQVDLIIKNKKLDELEKKGLLESEVEKLEEKAKRKEMVNKYYKGKKGEEADADNNEEVDQIYINAIKAKLELLGN